VFGQLVGLKDRSAPPTGSAPEAGLRWRRLGSRAGDVQRRLAVGALTGSGLVLVLATYVGRQSLLVAAVALFAGALLTLLAGEDRAFMSRALAGVHVSAAWVLGHAALAPLNGRALGLALVVGLATYARYLSSTRPVGARWVLRWTWVVLLLASIQGRQPFVTAALAVGGLAELMNQDLSGRRAGSAWASAQGRVAWLAATALTALASARWG